MIFTIFFLSKNSEFWAGAHVNMLLSTMFVYCAILQNQYLVKVLILFQQSPLRMTPFHLPKTTKTYEPAGTGALEGLRTT